MAHILMKQIKHNNIPKISLGRPRRSILIQKKWDPNWKKKECI
jgi:hypothetical protein